MKKIINNSNRKLVFPKFDLVIEPGEIKEISDDIASDLLGNEAIKEVLSKTFEPKVEEVKLKGRRKNYKLTNN